MLPEDRLDTLLSLHVERKPEPAESLSAHDLNGHNDLQPLLDVADRLANIGNAEPSPDFTARLEAQFLARAAYLRERDGIAPTLAGTDEPTLPSIQWIPALDDESETTVTPMRHSPVAMQRRSTLKRLLWPVLAATLLLAIGMTTFTAAAAAGPGTPLYGLRRWEQSMQVSIASNAADRTRLHIGYAQDALAALKSAAAQHQTGAPYDDALETFRDESHAAANNLEGVPAGGDRDALSSRLEQLLAQGRSDLHAALAVLPWSDRVTTTVVLADIGDTVLSVTQADMVYSSQGQHIWQITVTGSGFQQGAVLLVNGKPAGTVISVSPTSLVARISGDDSGPLPDNIGVANPDDTVSLTTNVSGHDPEDNGTPSPEQTPGTDDHSGSGTGGDSGSSGSGSSGGTDGGSNGSGGSPTPSPTGEGGSGH